MEKNIMLTIQEAESAKVGDYIKFGSYPQTSTGQKQPIEWQILSKENNKIFVISRYGLDTKRFDSSSSDWKNSEIRSWLNSDFYNEAFDENEKKNISSFDSDNVFLLSAKEAEKYFANDEARKCKPTKYALKKGVYVDDFSRFIDDKDYGVWLLRSPSFFYQACVFQVICTGDIRLDHVSFTDRLVRPALWINI